MNILFARRGFSNSGGAERYLSRLVRGLQAKGIKSTLLTDGAWPEEQWPGNHRIVLSSKSPASFSRAVAEEKSKHPGAILFSLERIPCADVFRAGDGVHRSYLERLATECSTLQDWFRRRRRKHMEICQLEKQLFTENPNLHVICNSNMVASDLNRYFDFPISRTKTIYNGFTPEAWTPHDKEKAREQIRDLLHIPHSSPIVLFVGTGWKRKGAHILASAFKNIQNQNAHLVLVGKGRLSRHKPNNIHITGPVLKPAPYFLAADLFALPTLHDPFSNACLEAAAYGLPVLTTDGNGFAEAISRYPDCGEVIPIPRNPTVWTKALDSWLGRTSAPGPCHELLATHTIDQNVDQTIEYLNSLPPAKPDHPPNR